MTDLHLIAFTTNATSIERACIEWTIAAQGLDGNWYQWDGQRLYPFFTTPIYLPTCKIPEGWIEHLQSITRHTMHEHAAPIIDLATALGLREARPTVKPFPRRL